MKKTLGTLLVVIALACAGVGILITAGLFPAQEPEPVVAVPLVPQKPVMVPVAPAVVARTRAPEANAFVLCEAPDRGASLALAPTNGEANRVFAWCQGGYLLFEIDLLRATPNVTKLVYLPTELPRPGGALLVDVTADATPDLVVAVSPDEGVVHAPGSAVFLAKGRSAGGFEAAQPLLEMPVVSLTTLQLEAAPKPAELFVLTRGDAASRRQGELVWFRPGPTPLKHRSTLAGLSPRDLLVWQPATDAAPELLVTASDPGRVIAWNPSTPDVAPREAPLVDAQQLCATVSSTHVFARTTHDLFRVEARPALGLASWFPKANVGRCQAGDLDANGTSDALAVTDAGFIWLRDTSEEGAPELSLPEGFRALDVLALPGEPRRVLGLALDVTHNQLVLLIWSALPWNEDLSLSIPRAPEPVGPPRIEIPLE